ncbi:FKBP-type peptidyl-prolyl cis-trans isomerase [Desulfoplanes sp.]
MTAYPDGSFVSIHFEGKLIDGDVFESTEGNDPMTVCLGNHEILEKVENAIRTMTKGETRSVHIGPDEGYGEYREDRIITISEESMPAMGRIKPGQELILRTPEGEEFPGIILAIENGAITIDANHPLAGEELEFRITLEDVTPPESGINGCKND